jgi:hypothetical protein
MRKMDLAQFCNDGSDDYLGVIVQYATEVFYCQQCGGTACYHREVEGYFVPLFRIWDNFFTVNDLSKVFHNDQGGCLWGTPSPDQVDRLLSVVKCIPYWDEQHSCYERLGLDNSRLSEVVEAWVPVLTPDGPGILTWPNCD